MATMLENEIMLFYLPAIILLLLCHSIQASNHYCTDGCSITRIDISVETGQTEKIFPTLDDPANSVSNRNCRWEISAPVIQTEAAVLVLSGFNVLKVACRRWERSANIPDTKTAKIKYQLHGPIIPKCSPHASEDSEEVESEDLFRVLQLPKRSYLSIAFEQASNAGTQRPPGLMIQVMEKGFCSREMLDFEQRCHRISAVQRSLMDELKFINGDSKMIQLASFGTLDAIRKFVVENSQEIIGSGDEVRTKVPLDLSQPVRIGIFYNKRSRSITYLSAGRGECVLKEIQDSATFNFTDLSANCTHACASLRVDQLSGREIVEFRNCNERLPALISFADTPREDCSSCTEPVVNWLLGLRVPEFMADPEVHRNFTMIMALASAGGLVALVLILTAVLIAFRKRRIETPVDSDGKDATELFIDIGDQQAA